jgi:excisionase family DNA binding protein
MIRFKTESSVVSHYGITSEELAKMQTTEIPARLLTIEAVMERLSVARSTVYNLMDSGQLRSVKVGRRRLVPESGLVSFIDGLTADAS